MIIRDGNEITLTKNITAEDSEKFKQYLGEINADITILMDCEGGECEAMFEMVEQMKNYPHEITTMNIGLVASAALTLFVCGNRRLSLPNANFMFHRAVVTVDTTHLTMLYLTIHELADTLKHLTEDTVEIFNIMTAHSDTTDKLLTEYTENDKEWWFSPKTAVFYKIADEIVEGTVQWTDPTEPDTTHYIANLPKPTKETPLYENPFWG